jgi:hypothetical protein
MVKITIPFLKLSPDTDQEDIVLKKGDYVLATKYNDGDPEDHWCVGYYDSMTSHTSPRYLVVDGNGKHFRANGFRRAEKITQEVGAWLIRLIPCLTPCPVGVNIWNFLPKMEIEE